MSNGHRGDFRIFDFSTFSKKINHRSDVGKILANFQKSFEVLKNFREILKFVSELIEWPFSKKFDFQRIFV